MVGLVVLAILGGCLVAAWMAAITVMVCRSSFR
jgi:hypothetical protein